MARRGRADVRRCEDADRGRLVPAHSPDRQQAAGAAVRVPAVVPDAAAGAGTMAVNTTPSGRHPPPAASAGRVGPAVAARHLGGGRCSAGMPDARGGETKGASGLSQM